MEPLKEQLNLKNAEIIALQIKKHHAPFKINLFLEKLSKELPKMELKQRIKIISTELLNLLPDDPYKTFPILIKASKQLAGFKSWPLIDLVPELGMNDVEYSLVTLLELTSQFSAEFAIRPFLIQHEKITLQFLRKNLTHSDHHVRRLISEGTRPLLPWGQHIKRFKEHPHLTWDFLEVLKNDTSDYVRKSVANHLNDHSKKHAEWLIKQISDWNLKNDAQLQWVVKHGLRTLIKNANHDALRLMGVNIHSTEIKIEKISPSKVTLGKNLDIHFMIKNKTAKHQKVIVDLKFFLLRANQKYTQKVFKGTKLSLAPHEIKKLKLDFKFKKVTTRKYYSGKHQITLLANGLESEIKSFTLHV
jgi:3-methyladenine DNA glycosylase AlkC